MRTLDQLKTNICHDGSYRVLRITFLQLREDMDSVNELAEKSPSGWPYHVDFIEVFNDGHVIGVPQRLVRVISSTREEIKESLQRIALG